MPADHFVLQIPLRAGTLELLSEVLANEIAAASRQLARGGIGPETDQLLDRISTLGEIVVACGTAALNMLTNPPTPQEG